MKLKSMGLGWHPFFMKWKIKHVWNHQPEFKSTSILHFFLVDILQCEAKSFLTGFNMFHLFLRTLWISQLGTWSNRLGIQNSWNHQVSAEVLRGEKKPISIASSSVPRGSSAGPHPWHSPRRDGYDSASVSWQLQLLPPRRSPALAEWNPVSTDFQCWK